ncbi:MAG: hypothetical protein AAF823_09240 [Planctomycetota bacterium]
MDHKKGPDGNGVEVLRRVIFHPPQSRGLMGVELSTGLNLLATMVTTTTYGTWLPGDVRGYVEDGRVLPGDPFRANESKRIMRSGAVYLDEDEQDAALRGLIAACEEFGYRLIAVSIESWHAHALLSHGGDSVTKVVGRLKNRMRQAIGRGRVWAKGYDKRYCFSEAEVLTRRAYIQRHRGNRTIPSL